MSSLRWRKGGSSGRLRALLLAAVMLAVPLLHSMPLQKTAAAEGARAEGGETPPAQYDVGFNMSTYYNYTQVQGMLHNISSKYPQITRLYSIGRTCEGRYLWAIKVSDRPDVKESEPEVLYIGLHHAREWSSVQVVMYFLHYIVANYGKPPTDDDRDGKLNEDPFNGLDDDGDGKTDEDAPEAQATWLVDNRQLWFIPVFNPDGFEYCWDQYYGQGIKDESVLWRKNREPNSNPVTGDPYPEYVGGKPMWGTDLNRNYGWHWGEVGYQGYVDPSREDYAGPWDRTDSDGDGLVAEDNMDGSDNDRDGRIDEDPRGGFSTAETRALKAFLKEHRFVILMSYHTYKVQGTIYWAYMYTRQLPPDERLFTHLAEGMFVYNGYEYRNYTGADQTRKGPLVDGDLNDYAYGALGILSYCIELRQAQFIPEPSVLPQLEGENLGVNIYLAEVADEPWGRKILVEHKPLTGNSSGRGPYVVKARMNFTGDGPPVELGLEPPSVIYTADGGATWETLYMGQGRDGLWRASIPGQHAGTRITYYIKAKDAAGIASYSPLYAPAEVHSFVVGMAGGGANPALLWLHIIFMVGGLAVLIPGMVYAGLYLRRPEAKRYHRTVEMAGISTGLLFIGGFPLGWVVAYQEYGTPWTGIPFGWDITDNKTLLIFLVWVASLYLVRGSLMGFLSKGTRRFCPFKALLKAGGRASGRFRAWQERERKDTLSKAGFAKLFLVATLATFVIYLIPHSIRF